VEPVYSIEERLLLDCASFELDSDGIERIRAAIDCGLDWKRVAELAARHCVTLHVRKRLESICPEVFKLPGADILKSRARFIAERNLQLTREMLSLVRLLESHGIASVPLKGPVLAMAAYGNLSSREFGDIDLLVHPKDLNQACALLSSAKYKPEFQLPRMHRVAYIRSEHAFTYYREQDRITVELHWRLPDRYLSFPLSNEILWNNIGSETIFGTRIRCLKPEHNFIFLCMHGAKHSWERVEWISSLRALVHSQPPARWPLIVSEAARLRSTRLLHLGLMLADHLSPSPATRLPLNLMQPDEMVDDLAATVWEQIFTEEITGLPREVYRFRFYLKAREHLWDRLRVVWSASVRIPHPQSSIWQRTSVPPSLLFLHYLLKPLSLLKRFGVRGLRGIIRPQRERRNAVECLAKRRL